MKLLYLDCSMGAAGDMLTAALYELLDEENRAAFLDKINHAGIPGAKVSAEPSVKCGITGTHIRVTVEGIEEDVDGHDHHSHHSMHDIEDLIGSLDVSETVRENAVRVYGLIAEAESHAHGRPVSEIHFHEVGTMDAVADVVSVCCLMDLLSPDKIVASHINVGGGHVHCAHGILPVPAPATEYILKGVPIYSGHIHSELCTPTGAALLKHFVSEYSDMPLMRVEKTGYGCGKKDFEQANCVRAFFGNTPETGNSVVELSCNVDDMTPERIGYAMEVLFKAGALDVYTVPVGMKKSRPGIVLNVICRDADREKMLGLIFKHTTTIGVRENISRRYILDRRIEKKDTPYGPVRRKVSEGFGIVRSKWEYEDIVRIADEQGSSIEDILKEITCDED